MKLLEKWLFLPWKKNRELHELSLEEMKTHSRQIDNDVYAWLDPQLTVGRRNIPGGTGPDAVRNEIETAKKQLKAEDR